MEKAKREEIRLKEWEEIVDIFKGIVREDSSLSVLFNDFKITFHPGSVEGRIVEEALNEGLVGEKIAILRTDIPTKPIIVRKEKNICPEEIKTKHRKEEQELGER
jgi:hypothetical protein